MVSAKSDNKKPTKKASSKHKYFSDQLDDEEVLFIFRKHPVVMRKGLVLGMLGILVPVLYVGILTYVRPDNPPSLNFFFGSLGVGFILGALLMFPSWITWYFSIFIVTDQRFIQVTQKGMFHRSLVDVSLNQVQMVNYEVAGFQETVLGFGTIMMQTYMGDLVIHNVHHPGKIQKRLTTILRDKGIITASGSSLPPALTDQADLADQSEDEGDSKGDDEIDIEEE